MKSRALSHWPYSFAKIARCFAFMFVSFIFQIVLTSHVILCHLISYHIISKSYHMYSHVTHSFFLSCAVSLWSVAVNLTCAYQYLSHRANGRMAWETVWDNKLGQMEPATVVSVLPEFLRLEIATTIFMGDNYSFFAPFWPRCVVVYVFFKWYVYYSSTNASN